MSAALMLTFDDGPDPRGSRLTDGAVVLARDGVGPGARRHDCTETASFVHLCAEHAAAHNLRLAAL